MEPIEELRFLVLAAEREGSRFFAEALRPWHLTPPQAEVLRVLQDHEPLSLIALGDLLVSETGSPSRLVNGLVEAGLAKRLERSDGDADVDRNRGRDGYVCCSFSETYRSAW